VHEHDDILAKKKSFPRPKSSVRDKAFLSKELAHTTTPNAPSSSSSEERTQNLVLESLHDKKIL
jgi:BRCT domain type II-containing protein